ncbi:MAG: hypothetical protein WCP01_10430 [Methylococcaceae bacterium]
MNTTVANRGNSKNNQPVYSIKTRVKIHLIAISMNALLWLALVPLVGAYA